MILEEYSIRFPKSFIWRTFAYIGDLFYVKRENSKSIHPKKILVIRKDEIGDLILSIPMYENIKKEYPKSKLTVIAGNQSASLLKGNPFVDKIIRIDNLRSNKINFIKNYFSLVSEIKKEKFDLAIDPKGSILNIFLMYLARIKERVSYWNVSGGKALLTLPVKYEKQIPEIDAGINLLAYLGKRPKRIIPKLYLSKEELKEGSDISSSLPNGYCCAYITPTLLCKSWGYENWTYVFKHFPEIPFVIVAREQERPYLENEFKELKNVQILCISNLRILSVVLKKSKAIIAVDGGILHLSWISNPKVISLFGQNDLILWKPLRGKSISHIPLNEQGLNRKPLNPKKLNKYMQMIKPQEVCEILGEYVR